MYPLINRINLDKLCLQALAEKTLFIVDASTRRITNQELADEKVVYDHFKALFEEDFPKIRNYIRSNFPCSWNIKRYYQKRTPMQNINFYKLFLIKRF
jgi:endonuclease III-like uncharacterized protein